VIINYEITFLAAKKAKLKLKRQQQKQRKADNREKEQEIVIRLAVQAELEEQIVAEATQEGLTNDEVLHVQASMFTHVL
jgi:hypothetical protein